MDAIHRIIIPQLRTIYRRDFQQIARAVIVKTLGHHLPGIMMRNIFQFTVVNIEVNGGIVMNAIRQQGISAFLTV
jgi:hypothetical protein